MDDEPLSPAELDVLWALEAQATPGPVEALEYHGPGSFQGAGPLDARAILRHAVHPSQVLVRAEGVARTWSFNDLPFYAALRNAAPRLRATLAARDAEIARLRTHLAQIARTALLTKMEVLSEEYWSAQWCRGIEERLWEQMVQGPPTTGMVYADADLGALRELAGTAGGWWTYQDDQLQFVPLAEWEAQWAATRADHA